MTIAFAALAAYLYGAVPYAYGAVYLFKGKRLTSEGTGNVGVTNAFKVGGTWAGVVTVLGEISKAALPIFMARRFFAGDLHLTLLFTFLALVGTSFSVFLRGKGGKGSTLAGYSLLFLSPYSFLIVIVLWAPFFFLSRGNPRIKKIPLLFVPFAIYGVERDWLFAFVGLLTAGLFYLNSYRRKDDYAHYHIFRQKAGA